MLSSIEQVAASRRRGATRRAARRPPRMVASRVVALLPRAETHEGRRGGIDAVRMGVLGCICRTAPPSLSRVSGRRVSCVAYVMVLRRLDVRELVAVTAEARGESGGGDDDGDLYNKPAHAVPLASARQREADLVVRVLLGRSGLGGAAERIGAQLVVVIQPTTRNIFVVLTEIFM